MESNSITFFSSKSGFDFLTAILDVPNVDKLIFRTSSDQLLSNAYIETSDFLSMEGRDQILKSQFFGLLRLKICNFKIGVDNLSLLSDCKDLVFL